MWVGGKNREGLLMAKELLWEGVWKCPGMRVLSQVHNSVNILRTLTSTLPGGMFWYASSILIKLLKVLYKH